MHHWLRGDGRPCLGRLELCLYHRSGKTDIGALPKDHWFSTKGVDFKGAARARTTNNRETPMLPKFITTLCPPFNMFVCPHNIFHKSTPAFSTVSFSNGKFRTVLIIHSFIPAISIAPLQVLYHSEALPTTARILYRSFTPKRTGNCR